MRNAQYNPVGGSKEHMTYLKWLSHTVTKMSNDAL